VLTVCDNGLGIDLKEHGKEIFGFNKVFHKHPNAKGVGLFLTKAQVEDGRDNNCRVWLMLEQNLKLFLKNYNMDNKLIMQL
jgi:sensor histidine kinase regulating citrate/malate metabolism